MLEARIDLLMNGLDLLKRKETTGFYMEVVRRKVANAKGDMKKLNGGLRRNTFRSYASIRQNDDQLLLVMSNR